MPPASSIALPGGGNTTGFTQFEYSMCGKWPELLKEIAPRVTRAAVLRLRDVSSAEAGESAAIQTVAPSLGVAEAPFGLGDAGEIGRGIAAFPHAECRSNCNDGPVTNPASSTDHHAHGSAPLAGNIPVSFLRHGGRPNFLGPDRVDPHRPRRRTLIVSSRVRNLAIFPCRRRPSMSW